MKKITMLYTKRGISVAFDREHQELYEGTFEYKNLGYNKYHILDLTNIDIYYFQLIKIDSFLQIVLIWVVRP